MSDGIWTRPFMRAERLIHDAGEHFLLHRWREGIEAMHGAREEFEKAYRIVIDHDIHEDAVREHHQERK